MQAGLDCYARPLGTQLAVTQLQQHSGRPASCLASDATSCALAAACAQVLRRPHVLLTTLLVCNAVAAEVRCGGNAAAGLGFTRGLPRCDRLLAPAACATACPANLTVQKLWL